MGEIVSFMNGQRVEIGAQHDAPRRIRARQTRHHARPAQSARHLVPQRLQFARHNVCRAVLLETQFGMGLQIASQLLPMRVMRGQR
ncbi:hypothetical protein AWB82_07157 [Caballeronia glebae]|uniref:Uncharacterized protein n=1 Tax=Caballeronia glebae TaxID=1777143 RepID=A0A158DSW6_9BURK|nr:hypothetical protein AWB82_07157 [Caballeronia glebae]